MMCVPSGRVDFSNNGFSLKGWIRAGLGTEGYQICRDSFQSKKIEYTAEVTVLRMELLTVDSER